ncbi:MAG TPA: hypothetical protein PLL75_04265 [Candidatus Omnitrophota bacterium]|nr:hypothetical protein [Candidatus Omnitrophota bacterium]HPS36924.1 hypothetical protein [Candidatus Omnitrophota bacterium]
MKLIGRIVFLVLAVLVVLVLARNIVVKTAIEVGATAVTGFPLTIQKLDINFSNTSIDIEGLVMKNPSAFQGTSFVEIPKILVDYNLTDILKGKIHLENLDFEMEKLSVVKNEKGMLNLDSLKSIQGAQKPAAQKPSQPAPAGKGKAMPFQIDNFHLKVGKASYVDYSKGQPSVQEFNVGLDERYQNITDPMQLVPLIVMKVMMRTPLALLSGFNLSSIQGSVSGIAGSAADMAQAAAAKGLDTLKNAAGTQAGGAVKEVTSSVTSAASSLKNKLKIPFGKSE